MSKSDLDAIDKERRGTKGPRTEQKLIIVGYYPT